MRYVDIARITKDVYLTDLAVVISTNFYFTIQHRRILLLLYVRFLKFKERKKIRFYCQCFVAFIAKDREIHGVHLTMISFY